jgi:hypothetical protein
MAASLAPGLPPQPRQTSANWGGRVMLLLSSRITALNCLSRAISTGSTCICSALSPSRTRCNKVAASGVKRWESPEALMLTSRRSSTCVWPSSVIPASCNQPKIRLCTKSAPLISRLRWMKPVSRANCSASSSKIRSSVSTHCATLFMVAPSFIMSFANVRAFMMSDGAS